MNTNELFKNREIRLGFASFIGLIFMSFVIGWVFLIPMAAVAFLLYGYVVYTRDQKHKINLNYKPNEAMKAIICQEMELTKEKRRIIK